MAETKKYRVTKKWTGGPAVGTILTPHNLNQIDEDNENPMLCKEGEWGFYFLHQLKGFVEEVKEPEWTWYINPMGDVCRVDTYATPNWLRFKSKEACEKFAKALKDTHGTLIHHSWKIEEMAEALNQRVTK